MKVLRESLFLRYMQRVFGLTIVGIFAIAAPGAAKPAVAGLTAVETVLVDGEATGYATFQSNNNKVVSNKNGIFMTHIRSRNDAYTAQQWRLSRSTDGGQTFSTIFDATDATNPPVLETDETGNLYLIRPDFVDMNAYLYRFRADKNYTDPLITTIPSGSGGKYAMMYDAARARLYYSNWGSTFYALDLEGKVLQTTPLTVSGTNAAPQYPLFSLAPDGMLHMAWTTVKHNEYLYWDIHHVETPDGGATWQNMNGAKITPPVKVDDSGPTDRITLDDEFPVHTWCSNMMEKDGKLHFLYLAQAPLNREHYMRYDARTGVREIDIQPEFKGTHVSLSSLDGYFAKKDSLVNGPLYCISNSGGKIGCLASDDNGSTWYDYAVSNGTFNPYSVGGGRSITADGYIIGSFTDSQTIGKVYFIRIKAGLSKAGVQKSSFNNGKITVEFTGIYGQPEKVRFSADGKAWGDWTGFAANLTAPTGAEPRYFQLRSRMGVDSEVFEISPSTPTPEWKTWNTADGLKDSLFLSVAGSRDEKVWVSSQQGGVSWYDGSSWSTLTTADGLPSNYVFSILEGKDGAMWFGTYGAGAVRYDGTSMQVYNTANGLKDNFVYTMASEPGGAIWFGSHWNGVTRYDGEKFTTYSTEDGLAANTVMAIAVGLDGGVWFGYGSWGNYGMTRYDGKSWKTYTTADGLVSNQVSALAVGKDGAIWAGHYASGEFKGGVSRFDGEKWTKITSADGLISDYISTIATGPDGNLWFGGYGGASRYDGTTFTNYSVADGIGHRWVKSIGFEKNGATWFATYGYDSDGGVTRYFSGIPTTVAASTSLPGAISILGNYPNPFNPATSIEFLLPREAVATVAVYSITGQRVRTLAAERLSPGMHTLLWDGRDDSGRAVSSGVYLAEVRAEKTRVSHRMTLLR